MSRRDRKKKDWLLRRNRKILRHLRRKKRHHYSVSGLKQGKQRRKISPLRRARIITPRFFSLQDNIEETVEFFSIVQEKISEIRINGTLFFDLEAMEEVSADAIMYLLAVIRNTKRIKTLHIHCKGNVPRNEKTRNKIEEIGFYDYVSPLVPVKAKQNHNKIHILSGKNADEETDRLISDFVIEKSGFDSRVPTRSLYSILMEMMVNVCQHAYKSEEGRMNSNWYIYVENHSEAVKFVFLDTGLGIPATIRRNWFEDKAEVLFKGMLDSRFISGALNGAFRTETKKKHRGKGLPDIYHAFIDNGNRLSNLSIISGKGSCRVSENGDIIQKTLKKTFEGTLFRWDFEKAEKL